MAELFWWFEVVKPSFVKPRMLDSEGTGKCLNSEDDIHRTISNCFYTSCTQSKVFRRESIILFDHSSLSCPLRALVLTEEYASHPHLQGNQEELHGETPKPRKTQVC